MKRNFDKFCTDYNINDDRSKILLLMVFYRTNRFSKEEKKQMKQFIKSSNFYLRLAKDLPTRRLPHLISAARRKLCPIKKFKDVTDEDRARMTKLYMIHKIERWTTIAEMINCNFDCVLKYITRKYRKDGTPYDKGKWTSDEGKILLEGMKEFFNTNDLSKHIFDKNIGFREMDKNGLIKINRAYEDCRSHWLRSLRWKIANYDQFEDNFSRSDASKLIYCLFKIEL